MSEATVGVLPFLAAEKVDTEMVRQDLVNIVHLPDSDHEREGGS